MRRSRSAWRRATRGCGTCDAALDSLELPAEYDEALWHYFMSAADSLRNVPG